MLILKKNMKVLIGPSSFAELDRSPFDCLVGNGFEVIENPFKRRLTEKELIELLKENVTGLIAGLEPLSRSILQGSSLKVISRCGAGMSNVDQKAAQELNIKVCSTPYGPTTAVAELTIGAMLSLLRMVPMMDNDLHNGKWKKRVGHQLEGKTVVIIGYGRIGERVAELLVPFKVKILAVDPYSTKPDDKVSFMALEEALPKADIITIHSSGEVCILGEKELDMLKSGVFLLNVARGGLVNETAILNGLNSGKVAGAWFDTFLQEPYCGPLTQYKQVILTPHVGSYTSECRKKMEMESVENLINTFKELQ